MAEAASMRERSFTKEDPCTKVHIYNCFYGNGATSYGDGLVSTDITRAKAYIGRHVPYRLVQAGRAEMVIFNGERHIRLTEEGVHWLYYGLKKYLGRNKEKAKGIERLPRHWRRKYLKRAER